MDPNTTPALAPPFGVVPNFVDPFTLNSYLILTSTVCLTLTTLMITIRMVTKAYVIKIVTLEDYAILFAGAGFAVFTGFMLATGYSGCGRHQWDVTVTSFYHIINLSNITEMIYCPVMFAAKLSLLLQLRRIFTGAKKTCIYWAFQFLIWANFLFYMSVLFVFAFACNPRQKLWDPSIPGTCLSSNSSILSTNSSILSSSALNILSDFSILMLPLFGTYNLNIPLRQKLVVGAVFGTGVLACLASIARLLFSIRLTKSDDITWDLAPLGMLAIVEIAMVIFVSCCPIMPRFFIWLSRRPTTSHECSNIGGSRKSGANYNREISIRQPEKAWNANDVKSEVRPKSARYQPLDDRVFHYQEMARIAKEKGLDVIDLEFGGTRKAVRVETKIFEIDDD